jgi:hypothetical protein
MYLAISENQSLMDALVFIYLAGCKVGPSLVGLNKPPPTDKEAYHFQK